MVWWTLITSCYKELIDSSKKWLMLYKPKKEKKENASNS